MSDTIVRAGHQYDYQGNLVEAIRRNGIFWLVKLVDDPIDSGPFLVHYEALFEPTATTR